MKQYGLNREMTQDKGNWRDKLDELFPRYNPEPEKPGTEEPAEPDNGDKEETQIEGDT